MKKLFTNVLEFVSKYKSYIIIVVIIIASVVSIIMENRKDSIELSINGETLKSFDGMIAVYITGEVANPGVYYIEEGKRLIDIIDECGGFTDEADITEINLAEKLNDSDKIYVPKKVEAEFSENDVEEADNSLININTASKSDLIKLEGIGDTLADNIISYRKNNKFKSIEDILNVDGIGQAKFDKIKEYICI